MFSVLNWDSANEVLANVNMSQAVRKVRRIKLFFQNPRVSADFCSSLDSKLEDISQIVVDAAADVKEIQAMLQLQPQVIPRIPKADIANHGAKQRLVVGDCATLDVGA